MRFSLHYPKQQQQHKKLIFLLKYYQYCVTTHFAEKKYYPKYF
jgi:hypothetical protein